MKATLWLYAPAVVLAVWALVWTVGLRSEQLVGAALALLAVTVFRAEQERRRRYR